MDADERMLPEQRYAALAEAFLGQSDVSVGGQGFGADALKSGGKIFAMLVRGRLVVKLPARRVTELLAAGQGEPFDANKGRPMREWLTVTNDTAWLALAEEARQFVKRRP
jgi:hypothetical protein